MNNELIIASFIPTVIDIEPRHYNKVTKTFSFEISDMKNAGPSKIVYLRNPKTDQKIRFIQTHKDMDGSHEDTYGWNYKSEDGQYKLLIIND